MITRSPIALSMRLCLGTITCLAASACAHAAPPTPPEGMVYLPGGSFRMGSEDGLPQEQPVHEVILSPFFMDKHEVTNAEFARFVAATGYETEAEKWGWSIAFLPGSEAEERVVGAEWWVRVDNATWRQPTGPGSSIEGKDDHPVVQVSWNDAKAYCDWAGKRLPTEAEWEYAARGGLAGKPLPWGEDFAPEGRHMANTWNGVFPVSDAGTDGHRGIAAVGQYPANGFGLHDMSGNVWEWVSDWYAARYYAASPGKNPQGPDAGQERGMRGGSFLCADNYCRGYRVAHRNKATPDSGLNHTGFRCAKDAPGASPDASS